MVQNKIPQHFLKWIMTDALEIMMERLAYAAEGLPIGSLPKT